MLGLSAARRRWTIVISIFAVATAVVATSVVAGQFAGTDPESFHEALATGDITRVASIAAGDGLPERGVFVQKTDNGLVCVWDAVSTSARQRGGGCNPAGDPLGGSSISASLSYEGGPAVSDVKDARIFGLAAVTAADVRLLMSDGSSRMVKLTRADGVSKDVKAFGYRFKRSDLKRGIGPIAVVAYDEKGEEIGRQTTGIG